MNLCELIKYNDLTNVAQEFYAFFGYFVSINKNI